MSAQAAGWLRRGASIHLMHSSTAPAAEALSRTASTPQTAQAEALQASASPPAPATGPYEQLMQHSRLTDVAHALWAQVLRPGDIVVDATCGNGHDTVFLARAVGPSGHVHAMDLQPGAVAATRSAVEDALPAEARPRIDYVLGCHSQLREAVGHAAARLICFNLGYLPGGDKSVTTTRGGTLAAAAAACEALAPGGLLSLLCYTGHPGGREEYEAVRALLAGLPPAAWSTFETRLINRPAAPVLVLAYKRLPV